MIFNQKINSQPFNIPLELQIDEEIIDYQIDQYRKSIYYLTKRGIFRKFYGGEKFFFNYKSQLILLKTKIKGIFLDISNNYLYYYKNEIVNLINLHRGIQKSLYITKNIITNFLILPDIEFFIF